MSFQKMVTSPLSASDGMAAPYSFLALETLNLEKAFLKLSLLIGDQLGLTGVAEDVKTTLEAPEEVLDDVVSLGGLEEPW